MNNNLIIKLLPPAVFIYFTATMNSLTTIAYFPGLFFIVINS